MGLSELVGRVVKIFITGQDPRSLRTVELDNWTGVAITGQPEFFKKALEDEVLSRSCVYLLIRSSADDDLRKFMSAKAMTSLSVIRAASSRSSSIPS